MADHADADGGDRREIIFIYTGGRAPLHVTRVRIDKSVTAIDDNAFDGNSNLLAVETHEGIRKVGRSAFKKCKSLRSIKFLGVYIIKESAFEGCEAMRDVELGRKLKTIEKHAFYRCISLRYLAIPSVRTIGDKAFSYCKALLDADLPQGLEAVGESSFRYCISLRRIGIPFNVGVILEYSNIFDHCVDLHKVDLVGGIHNTIASLHMESWEDEMKEVIDQINLVLPDTYHLRKTEELQSFIQGVHRRLEYYKSEHRRILREASTLLELALWKKAILDDNIEEEDRSLEPKAKRAKIDREGARQHLRIKSGADVVVKNVLPYLKLE